jgi:hypothetical protein
MISARSYIDFFLAKQEFHIMLITELEALLLRRMGLPGFD